MTADTTTIETSPPIIDEPVPPTTSELVPLGLLEYALRIVPCSRGRAGHLLKEEERRF